MRTSLALLAGAMLAAPWAAPAAGAAPARDDSAPRARVVIGSKNFTESHLLGELMAQVIAARTGADVEHRAGLGGTLVCFEALKSGQIDVYAEYTGTGWAVVLTEDTTLSDPMRTYLHVQSRFRSRYDAEWLQPFGFNNMYAIVMREARAESLGLRTLSDLAERAPDLALGFSVEFLNREDGWPGLRERYGLAPASVRGLEHALAYEALASGEVDVIDAYSTDAKLLRYRLRILADDRAFFPPYHAAPLARGALLREHPEVRAALEALAFRLPDARMTALNHAVEVEGRAFADVARAFLEEEGLLDPAAPGARAGIDRRRPFIPFFLARWRITLGLLGEHVALTLTAVLLAAALAIPLGIWIAARPGAARASLGIAGVVQTVPSLALLAVLIAVPGFGLSVRSAIAALFLYAVLPILRNTYTGVRDVDPALIDVARGMGLTEREILTRVRLPLATRTVMAGIRTSAVIAVGVATLAAFIGAGGLGEPIVTGLYLNDARLILSGAVPAALLALVADALLGALERRLTPKGLRLPG